MPRKKTVLKRGRKAVLDWLAKKPADKEGNIIAKEFTFEGATAEWVRAAPLGPNSAPPSAERHEAAKAKRKRRWERNLRNA